MTAPVDDRPAAARIEPPRSNRVTRKRRGGIARAPFYFVIPAVALYVLVVIFPNLQGAVFSFTDWDGFTAFPEFVGVENYENIVSDSNTTRAILNTFVLTVVVALFQNVIGLLLALGLNSQIKSKYVLRLVFFLPVVLTPIVTGYLWKYLLTPNGTLNTLLSAMGLENLQQDWLGNPDLVLFSICATIIWTGSGYSMIIYLAGLQAVPEELLEAAALDGAGAVRRTWSVTLPLINGAIVVNLLLCVLGNLKQFDTVFSMTGGGPAGASETMATIVYRTAFVLQQYPNALAQGVILTIVIGIIGFVQYRVTQRKALS